MVPIGFMGVLNLVFNVNLFKVFVFKDINILRNTIFVYIKTYITIIIIKYFPTESQGLVLGSNLNG